MMTKQVGGDHYSKMKIQPIDFIKANDLDYCEGNVIKYVTRHRHKNGREDLLKARHYIDFLLEEYEDDWNGSDVGEAEAPAAKEEPHLPGLDEPEVSTTG